MEPSLILALAVLGIFPFLCLCVAVWACLVVISRMRSALELVQGQLEKMSRKVLALSDRPTAQQLALTEATRELTRNSDVEPYSDEEMMAGQ